jgi:hypothetical protein
MSLSLYNPTIFIGIHDHDVTYRFQRCRDEKLVDDDTTPIDSDELIRKAWEAPLEPSSYLLMPVLQYQKEGIMMMVIAMIFVLKLIIMMMAGLSTIDDDDDDD